jgi:hypothetical protein
VARAFLLYGGLVTGPVTHHFYLLLDRALPGRGLGARILRVLADRLLFSPAFLALTLYTLGRLKVGPDASTALRLRAHRTPRPWRW